MPNPIDSVLRDHVRFVCCTSGGSLVNMIKSPYPSTGGHHTPCGSTRPITPACGPRVTLANVPPMFSCSTKRSCRFTPVAASSHLMMPVLTKQQYHRPRRIKSMPWST